MSTWRPYEGEWALILGASSGFGAAAARALGATGMGIAGVHLDRKSTLPLAEAVANDVRGAGSPIEMFNVNAADDEKRAHVLSRVSALTGGKPLRLMMHSIAFGTLRPFVTDDAKQQSTRAQLEMTLDVMATSLVYWVQDLCAAGLLGQGSRVVAMTSAGGEKVWPMYGVVSAAKAALESYVRQLACELAPRGITVNALRAGVTATPALAKIPGAELLLQGGAQRNPSGRLTQPEDVANALVALCLPQTQWITGNVLGVDGGENLIA